MTKFPSLRKTIAACVQSRACGDNPPWPAVDTLRPTQARATISLAMAEQEGRTYLPYAGKHKETRIN